MANSQCTVTLQQEADILQTFGDLEPILNVGGQTSLVMLTAANNVFNAICGVSFPHKWNEFNIPPFYINSLQQDYASVLPNGQSLTNLAWLERGIVIDINNTAQPKPYRLVECGRELSQATGTTFNDWQDSPLFLVNWLTNNLLYFGQWGAGQTGNIFSGNNPYPGAVYTNPVGSSVISASWSSAAGGQIVFQLTYIPSGMAIGTSFQVTGAYPQGYNGSWTVVSIVGTFVTAAAIPNPGAFEIGGVITPMSGIVNPNLSMPNNPITQIIDANGNYLVLTGYGTEGTAAPLAPLNASYGQTVSGTGATTVWTVVDPNGQGFRILPVPVQSGLVWQFLLVGQMKPVRFTSLNQTLAPFPDEFEPHFQMGLIAQLYRFSPMKSVYSKFAPAWALWLRSLEELRAKEDRELEENNFVPDRGIQGGSPGRNRFLGPVWPFNYPVR